MAEDKRMWFHFISTKPWLDHPLHAYVTATSEAEALERLKIDDPAWRGWGNVVSKGATTVEAFKDKFIKASEIEHRDFVDGFVIIEGPENLNG